jgi:hypothetical protein
MGHQTHLASELGGHNGFGESVVPEVLVGNEAFRCDIVVMGGGVGPLDFSNEQANRQDVMETLTEHPPLHAFKKSLTHVMPLGSELVAGERTIV